MDSRIALLDKLREERIAREKARIEKLRQINLQKYNCTNKQSRNSTSSVKPDAKPVKSDTNVQKSSIGRVKNNFHVNDTSKRPVSAPSTKVDAANIPPKNNIPLTRDSKPGPSNRTITAGTNIITVNESNKTVGSRKFKIPGKINKTQIKSENVSNMATKEFKTKNLKQIPKRRTISAPNTKTDVAINVPSSVPVQQEPTHESLNVMSTKETNKFTSGVSNSSGNINKMQNKNENLLNVTTKEVISNKCSNNKPTSNNQSKLTDTNNIKKGIPKVILNKSANLRKSMAVERPKVVAPTKKSVSQTSTNQSVFERLYNPKPKQKVEMNEVEKLHKDPNYLNKIIKRTGLIINTRHTMEYGPKIVVPVRRSISAVHFKRISKNELSNCIHKWSSVSSNLNKSHIKHIDEDETVSDDKVVSAVKSERKKVKFMTPMSNLNTPKPEELQLRLKTWLQKRGKSLDSYHHLQCFGIQHLPQQLKFDTKLYDDEDKENIELDSDSDDGSYTENMNKVEANTWRTADSYISDSVDFNESANTTLTYTEAVNTDELLLGALNDLTELLKEGFSWEQCARWLRAIREQFPSAPQTAAYWECRAALEERRGDLPASVECWEEAIAKGTEHSVVEASLDQLLDKFMQLKISPNSGKRRDVNPKLVDVKNVFKSTIIRFAVQQAKLRQSAQFEGPHFTVTPVRRSARLTTHLSANRTPLQECSTFRQADKVTEGRSLFVPNVNLCETP